MDGSAVFIRFTEEKIYKALSVAYATPPPVGGGGKGKHC